MDAELLAETCDDVIRHCLQLGSEDNMTALLVKLEPGPDRKIDFDDGE
jgi:serine/threonine protein phosphatase PrpC